MPLQPFRSIPRDIIEWAKYFTSLLITPDPGTITDETFANRTPNSVIGRAGATPGPPADIAADAERQFLVNRAGGLEFDGIEVGDLPASVATDSEVASAVAAAISAHTAAVDPHPGYLTQTEGDARYVQSAGFDTADVPEGTNLYFTNARAQAAARLLIVRSITSTDTVGATDDVIIADATAGAITVNLPALASNPGKRVTVKKIDASGNAVTLDGNSSEQIDGAATQAISSQWGSLTVAAGASSWYVI